MGREAEDPVRVRCQHLPQPASRAGPTHSRRRVCEVVICTDDEGARARATDPRGPAATREHDPIWTCESD